MKLLWTFVWGTAVLLVLILVAGRNRAQNPVRKEGEIGAAHVTSPGNDLSALYEVPPFTLTNQDSQPVSDQSLRGKVWIAQFIFTRCMGPCPAMLGKMRNLQDNLTNDRVRFISFSVDPNYDTPEILKTRAGELGADTKRWQFLTGDEKLIQDTAFKMLANAVPAAGMQHVIMHSEKFMLIDVDGKCRGVYSSDNADAIKSLINDTNTLVTRIENKK